MKMMMIPVAMAKREDVDDGGRCGENEKSECIHAFHLSTCHSHSFLTRFLHALPSWSIVNAIYFVHASFLCFGLFLSLLLLLPPILLAVLLLMDLYLCDLFFLLDVLFPSSIYLFTLPFPFRFSCCRFGTDRFHLFPFLSSDPAFPRPVLHTLRRLTAHPPLVPAGLHRTITGLFLLLHLKTRPLCHQTVHLISPHDIQVIMTLPPPLFYLSMSLRSF